MSPLFWALFSTWNWRIEIVIVLVTFGTLYTIGWRRLRYKSKNSSRGQSDGAGRTLATVPRLAAYLGGLGILAIALMSPIDSLGGQLFLMHMIQHLLTIMIAAPLLWLGSPFPIILWGLPANARRFSSRLMSRKSLFRQALSVMTRPGISWMIFIIFFIGWHDPNAYNLALRREWVHDLEHLTFFGSAMLYWWHVTGAGPRIHGRFPEWARIAYLLAMIPPNMMTGVTISFSSAPLYTYYESIPRFWGFSVMEDQMIGGVIMWIPGSMMYILAALILLATLFRESPQNKGFVQ